MAFSKDLLRLSQKEVGQLIQDNPFMGVFCDMGFGKTIVVLTAIEELLRRKEIKKILVVSTLMVSRDTWPDEILEWEHTRGIPFKFIHGTPGERLELLKGDEDIHIINQENFVALVDELKNKWPYDMVVFDDAKGLKNYKIRNKPKTPICTLSKDCPIYWPAEKSTACLSLCDDFKARPPRFSRFGALCRIRPKLKRLLHLTGTPSSKELLDLWPMLYTLDAGRRLGKTRAVYARTFFNKGYSGFGYELRDGAADTIHNKIKDICVAVESEAELPPVHCLKKPIKLGPEQRRCYNELEKEFIINIEGEDITAVNAGVLAGKLLQMCGGAIYTEDKDWVEMHDEKIKALGEIIEKHKGEPVLVGYGFKHELVRLKKAFPQGIDIRERKDFKKAWNRGEIPLAFAHPDSAGHGLNLQKGPGRTLVWFGINWSLDLNNQLNKRLHRPGQKRDVYLYYLVAEKTIDEDVLASVKKKDATQKNLLAAVKRSIKKRQKRLKSI